MGKTRRREVVPLIHAFAAPPRLGVNLLCDPGRCWIESHGSPRIAAMKRQFLAIAIAALLPGCGSGAGTKVALEPVRIAAASDLQAVMPKILERFKAETGVEVVATFGASGQLSQQIKQGAPFDVFLAANRKFVTDLAEAKVLDPATVQDYAVGSLALIVREEVPATVKTLADLKNPAIKKIALANPDTAPYGAAAKQSLERSGLWDDLEPKRVQAETVRQALQFVDSGNAEAGLVGAAIAKIRGVRIIPVDDSLHDPLTQSLGVIAQSKRKIDAMAFARFVLSGGGRDLLRDAGFRVDFAK
ncbi:MAG: molybdenum transporter, periplasmic molybdate-binding protein [Planctomycetota bacterium]|nr:molybdenum transporter, periplasmic molybdate-binding protein [Planctomycetota bacterium]